ncbi:MAG TPA: DUF4296 domain-containing protein [Bacteroidia bacterium]|jgi:hypothetical protein|nr:DUF4296 domain-containing protein [Bacteroidia bacterium]
MLNWSSLIFIIVIIIFSCHGTEKEIAIPKNVLDKEKFSDVIVDFTLAESASGINILNVQGKRSDTVYAFNPLIDNNVKRELFDTSLYFYSHHPRQFKEVYELALEKLSKLQASRK